MTEENTISGPGRTYSDEDIWSALRRVASRVDGSPTVSDYRAESGGDDPSSETIRRRFGDAESPWVAALTDAGLAPSASQQGRSSVDLSDATASVACTAGRLGEWPTVTQYREFGFSPSYETIRQLFGGWSEALEAARDAYPEIDDRVGPTADTDSRPVQCPRCEAPIGGDLGDVDDDTLDAETLDRRPASVRDIQALYGQLVGLARGDHPYALYHTPDAAANLRGTDRVLAVHIQMDGAETDPTLGEPAVTRELFTSELGPRVGHSKYGAARGVDHSITHQTGDTSNASTVVDACVERFTRWATESAVQSVIDDHNDGWMIQQLAALGRDTDVVNQLRSDAAEVADDGEHLVTVVVHTDESVEQCTISDRPYWPGDLDVLQEAGARLLSDRWSSKGDATDARGEAVGMVSGDAETVFGTVSDPLERYQTHQHESFPGFDPEESWRTHPIGRDTALAISASSELLDRCQSWQAGARVYALPYPREPSPAQLRRLYHVISNTLSDEHTGTLGPMLQEWIDSGGDASELLFHISHYHQRQKSVWTLLSEATDVSGSWIVEVANAHDESQEYVSECFNIERSDVPHFGFAGFDQNDGADRLDYVTSLDYWNTLVSGKRDDGDGPSIDDPRFDCHARLLQGQTITTQRLYDEYSTATASEASESDRYPTYSVLMREMQLHALRRLECLRDRKE